MPQRPLFNRTFLIPIAIGVVSILGIGGIFLISDPDKSRIPSTVTPSSFGSLRSETLTPSPSATSTQDEPPPTATENRPNTDPGIPAETLSSTSTLIPESLSTPSAAPTSDQFQPLSVGKHDDMDPNIVYGRYWILLKNPGTANAYKGTLHFSTSVGNEASFRFTGERFRLGYQRGKNFGIVTVIIDDQSYSFHEQAFDLLWLSPRLAPGDHVVQIIHESGESINLDYVEILY